jgi:hypothetical protein
MFKITALLTTLALAGTASIAMASPTRTYDRRTGVEYVHDGGYRIDAAPRLHGNLDRFARFDDSRSELGWHRGRGLDDFGPRRYRSTWVALSAPQRYRSDRQCIEVHDRGTFTQLRLQSNAGRTAIDRVIVQFADGSNQVAELDRELDRHGEFVELPLDGNNRRIDRIIVNGALGDLQVFAI